MKKVNLFAGRFRKTILLIFDCYVFGIIACAYYISLGLFKNPEAPLNMIVPIFATAGIILACNLLARLIFGIYHSVWRYTRTLSYLKLIIADIIGTLISIGIVYLIFRIEIGLEIFLILSPLGCLATISSRFCYRLFHKHTHRATGVEKRKIRVAIIGAGQLGAFLANELLCNHQATYQPLFFIDNDPQKVGNNVAGLKVYHEDERLFKLIKKKNIEELFVAVANLDREEAERLIEFYSRAKCKLKIYEIPVKDFSGMDDEAPSKIIRDFQIEDLLFRKPMKINNSATRNFYKNKTILVTGGGGSIGSELCRQIAKCSPKKLIILDIYENNAYEIQQELIRTHGSALDLTVEIASVRDRDRLDAIFNAYRPQIVFHAAAHKHVPLMEHSGCEAIKNNVLGTLNTADMAEKYGVEKFILISTDKAVNPTNIMGASKRMCEMVIQCRTDSKTLFTAVRFGNVLGSNGSVIPLFREQIKRGGPVTITDKRIIRYFMTIPEASQLVMQAGYMAKDGELFVLDMGKPVKIYDLAYNMIKLSGFDPDKEIEIKEIGLRPGEKLYEELLIKTEHLEQTENKKIFIEKDTPLTREAVNEKLDVLRAALESARNEIASSAIKDAFKKAVPTFVDPENINKDAEKSEEMKMTTA